MTKKKKRKIIRKMITARKKKVLKLFPFLENWKKKSVERELKKITEDMFCKEFLRSDLKKKIFLRKARKKIYKSIRESQNYFSKTA